MPIPVALVFARWWAEGPVKTRLAAAIGADAARAAYKRLAECAWSALEHPRLARHLWVSPGGRVAEAGTWLRGADIVVPQPGPELGDSLIAAFETAFARGAPWAAAVGTDAPDVDAALALRAGERLRDADVAIVPALDGGYALIALRAPRPELFRGVPWGTPEVLARTRELAAAAGLRVALLPPVADVDTLEDLKRWEARHGRGSPSTPGARLP